MRISSKRLFGGLRISSYGYLKRGYDKIWRLSPGAGGKAEKFPTLILHTVSRKTSPFMV